MKKKINKILNDTQNADLGLGHLAMVQYQFHVLPPCPTLLRMIRPVITDVGIAFEER